MKCDDKWNERIVTKKSVSEILDCFYPEKDFYIKIPAKYLQYNQSVPLFISVHERWNGGMTYSERKSMEKRGTAGDNFGIETTFENDFGHNEAIERASKIKAALEKYKSKSKLFFLYYLAWGEWYDEEKLITEPLKKRKEVKKACLNFQNDKVDSFRELKQIMNKYNDEDLHLGFSDKAERYVLKGKHGKDYWGRTKFFKYVVNEIVEEMIEEMIEEMKTEKNQKIVKQKIFKNIHNHLNLFGIPIKDSKVVENIHSLH